MPLKIALIGCGYWGRNFLRIIRQHPQTELIAICDVDEKRFDGVKTEFPHVKLVNDHRQLAQLPDVDAVIIASPVCTHFEIAHAMLLAGKHVLCEKPLTQNLHQALQLRTTMEKSGKVLMVGHIFEFNSAVRYAKSKLDEAYLGEVVYMYFKRTGLGPVRRDVNVLWDLASHDLSIVLYLLQQMPLTVAAFGQSYINEGVEDVGFMLLEFPGKKTVNIHVSWLDPVKERNMTIVGQKRMLVFNDVSINERVKIFEKGINYQSTGGDFGEFLLSVKDGDTIIPNIKYAEPLKTEFAHFVDCVLQNKQPQTNADNALRVMSILEAANKSLQNNNRKTVVQSVFENAG